MKNCVKQGTSTEGTKEGSIGAKRLFHGGT